MSNTNDRGFVIHGRTYYLDRIRSIETKYRSDYLVTDTAGEQFEVWGGKHSGGRSREWFVKNSRGVTTKRSSLIDSLRLIETA